MIKRDWIWNRFLVYQSRMPNYLWQSLTYSPFPPTEPPSLKTNALFTCNPNFFLSILILIVEERSERKKARKRRNHVNQLYYHRKNWFVSQKRKRDVTFSSSSSCVHWFAKGYRGCERFSWIFFLDHRLKSHRRFLRS